MSKCGSLHGTGKCEACWEGENETERNRRVFLSQLVISIPRYTCTPSRLSYNVPSGAPCCARCWSNTVWLLFPFLCIGSGLTWHFQDTDPDFGQTQAKNLQLHFEQMLTVSLPGRAVAYCSSFLWSQCHVARTRCAVAFVVSQG